MTHHDHRHHRQNAVDWDEDYGYGQPRQSSGQPQFGRQGPVDQGDYGGWGSGEGQGEFAGDGYSAQGQFRNQRVAQNRDQGYGQDYGRQGIGWQNRDDGNQASRQRMSLEQGANSGYWGQGAGSGQGIGESGSWRQEQSGGWFQPPDLQGQARHNQSWQSQGSGTGFSAAGSWMAGPHSGRGPQGYQRSDGRIEEDVCEHLTHHGMLDATGIRVQVENGEVTLTGTVESRQAKRLAEDILDSISGVRDVHNQLRVQQNQGQDHVNLILAQAQMGESDGQRSNGQSGVQSQRNMTKARASNS